MDGHGQCFSCGKGVAADAPYGLCPECLTRSVVFSDWKGATSPGLALSPSQNKTALQEGLFVGGGRFKLVRELGRGGMGVVWLAEDQRLRDGDAFVQVALKFLAPEIRVSPEAMEMMQREVLHSRRLRHRNIVSIYDWHSEEPDLPFISMEYVDGRTLSQLRRDQPSRVFDWNQFHPILLQICEALNYAHVVEEIVHRDLKPGNIMVDAQGVVKVADFGLAHRTSVGVESAIPGRGASGTLPYMSPQQLLGRAPHTSDDIYSLGVTMYEVLTGTPPFFQGNLLEQILNEPPQTVAQRLALMGLPNTVPAAVLDRIHQCLDKDPEHRPFPASEVLKLFWAPEEEAQSAAGGWGATVLLLLLLVAGGWWGLWAYRNRNVVSPEPPSSQPEQIAPVPSTNPPPAQTIAVTPAAAPAKPVANGRLRLAAVPTPKYSYSYEIRSRSSDQVVRSRAPLPPGGRATEELPPGDYVVSMECSSGRQSDPPSSLRQDTAISSNAESTNLFNFRGVDITIQTAPPGASVSFAYNGQPYQELTPYTFYEVTPGSREFKFSLEDHHDITTNIMIPGGVDRFPILVAMSRRLTPEVGKDWAFSSLKDPLFTFRWIGPFWAGVHEITRQQYAVFVRATGLAATNGLVGVTSDGWRFLPDHSWIDPGFPGFKQTEDDPVVGISWDEAQAFCQWLTEQDRKQGRIDRNNRYRLPTDGEFARMASGIDAGVGSGNFAGTEVLGRGWNTNWQTLTDDRERKHRDPFARTAPVGKTPGCVNPRGLRDLLGNAAEWGEEWYTTSMNPPEVLREIPLLNDDGGGRAYRVVRGGSWFNEQMRDIAPSTRWRFPPGERHDFVGFRLVLVNEPQAAPNP